MSGNLLQLGLSFTFTSRLFPPIQICIMVSSGILHFAAEKYLCENLSQLEVLLHSKKSA